MKQDKNISVLLSKIVEGDYASAKKSVGLIIEKKLTERIEKVNKQISSKQK